MSTSFSQLLSALQVEPVGRREFNGVEVCAVDLGGIYRRFTNPITLVVVRDEWRAQNGEISGKSLASTFSALTVSARKLAVLALPDAEVIDLESFPDSWVILTVGDIKWIAESKRPRSALGRIIRNQVRLEELSPYQTTYIASRGMFFGRENELREVMRRQHENFVIAGPRRIGKSSFAWELIRRLRADPGSHSGIPGSALGIAHVDCNVLAGENDEEEIFQALLNSLKLTRFDDVYKRRRLGKSFEEVSSFEFFKRITRMKYNSVLIVLDEVDGVVERDRARSWATLRKIQGLIDAHSTNGTGVEAGRTSVILLGFKKLFHALYDDSFPFYGRCRPLILENLSKEATGKLMSDPMKELGITIQNEAEVVGRVFHETGGMPSIIQSICREAVRTLGETGEAHITPKFIDTVIRSQPLHLDDYLRWIDYTAGPIERAIIYFAAPSNRFTVLALIEFLKKKQIRHIGVEALRGPLDDLTLANVLRQIERHKTYEFSVEALRKTLESRPERADALNGILEELRNERRNSAT